MESIIEDSISYLIKTEVWQPFEFDINGFEKGNKLKLISKSYAKSHDYSKLL